VTRLLGSADLAAVCVALTTCEVLRHREDRATMRARRAALSAADIARLEAEEQDV
jgi:hypothetical protein